MEYRHDLGNDRWIVEHVFPGKRNGYFIEAGVTNGVNGSGTYVLEKELGWNGICVEPQPAHHEYLAKSRSTAIDHRALWSRSGEAVEFTCFTEKRGRSGITSVNKNIAKLRDEAIETVTVETVSLIDLLMQHNAPKIVDYICLDVEGAENSIMGAFPFHGPYTILAISIEGLRCDGVMAANGYVLSKNPFTEVTFERYYLHPSVAGAAR